MLGTHCSSLWNTLSHPMGQIVPMLLFILMLVLGEGKAWAQGYSGVYYIANDNSQSGSDDTTPYSSATTDAQKYYLVPAKDPKQDNNIDAYYSQDYASTNGDPQKPFLTTYHTKKNVNKDVNSIWIVKKTDDNYYYVIHAITGRYVIYEVPLPNDPNKNNDADESKNGKRKTMHLQTPDSEEGEGAYCLSANNNFKFNITLEGNIYRFQPINRSGWYWNPANGNRNSYSGKSGGIYQSGLIGVYDNEDDGGSKWHFEPTLFDAPDISDVNQETNIVTVTGPECLPAGYKLRYTFSAEGVPDDPTATSDEMTNGEYSVTVAGTLKVVVERYGVVLSAVATKSVMPACCSTPVFTYSTETGKVTITSTEGASIYYTLDKTTPTSSSTLYGAPFVVEDLTTIKAIAIKTGILNSEIASVKLVLNPTITLAENTYTYDGSVKEPAVSSVKDVEDLISSDEYDVSYSNNIDVSNGAVVTISNKAGGNYIVYGSTMFTINPKAVTVTASNASKTYDGSALTENGYITTALETGDTHTFIVTMTAESTITNVGTQPNIIATVDGAAVTTGTETAVGNYLVTTANGLLTVNPKSLGDGTLAEGFNLEFDESGEMTLKYGSHTLTKDVDYTIGNEETGTKYSSRTISGMGNYSGTLVIRNAIVHFTTDANQAEWSATFVAESAGATDIGHVLPEGIAAYIISGIEGNWAIPEPLDYIPAGVPVLLVAHEEKNGFLVKDAKSGDVTLTPITDDQKSYNKLKEVTAESAHFKSKQIYVLYKNEFVLTKEGDLGRGKVYMENPNYVTPSSPAPASLHIAWGNVTGIEEVRSKMEDVISERWYTLDGRCLIGKPTSKGLYIVGGKKIVVK